MKKIITVLLFAACIYAGDKSYGNACVEVLVRVYDGDTFYACLYGMHPIVGDTISVRINGIDTPELRGSKPNIKNKGYQARDLVKSIFDSASVIELRDIKRGKYFRILADVYADGISIADTLIKSGLAYPYDGGTKQRW